MEAGYFCTLRYYNNRLRDEHINVGVLIYSPETNTLSYNICRSKVLNKVKFFYPGVNLETINRNLTEFEEIVKELNSNHNTIENITDVLNRFLKYSLRIRPFRRFMIEEIEDDLRFLFEDCVCSVEENETWQRFMR